MTLKRRSLLGGRSSPKNSPSKRRTAHTIHRRLLGQTVKQMTKPGGAAGVSFGAASKANLKVVVRVRPFNAREQANNASSVIQIVDEHMMVFDPKQEDDVFFYHGVKQRRDITKRQHKDQKFVFERVFGPDSTNQDVFNNTTKDIIDTLLQGYNCSVFAYGATGAGKTFTMVGRPECPGITLLTLMELYERIKVIEEEDAGNTIEVAVSYLEVYNEMVRDLLQPGKPLQVQESGKQVMVPGLSFHKPRDAEHLMSLLALGNDNRSQHPTDANAESSRSHAVFQVVLKQQRARANVSHSSVSVAKLSMIDLAGSERGAATGCKGVRFREGANINKSLLALGNCINALADGKNHIPYRDSKLTRLLKDSLGGNCRSVMVAAVSSASTTFEDTFNTLRYSNRAKTIKTTLKKNQTSVENHISAYVKIVEALKVELQQSKAREVEQAQQALEYEETIADLRRQLQGGSSSLPRIMETPTPDTSLVADDLTTTTTTTDLTEEPPITQSDDAAACAANTSDDATPSSPATAPVCCRCSMSLSAAPPVADGASVVEYGAPPAADGASVVEYDMVLEQDLRAVVAQVSGLHREALELASCERELELKLHIARLKKRRLHIIAFAAYKLNKSESKFERTECQLQERLQQTRGRRSAVEARLATAKDRYTTLAATAQDHQPLKLLLDAAERQECERVLVQQSSGLRLLVTECVAEVQEGHTLHCSLLWALRSYHVHLHSLELHNEKTLAIFQSVVTNMDEFRIAWADQQPATSTASADDDEDEEMQQQQRASQPPSLDVAWLTQLDMINAPLYHQPSIDVPQPSTLLKSIMKGSTSTLSLQNCHTSPLAVNSSPDNERLRRSTWANTITNKQLSSSSHHHPVSSGTHTNVETTDRSNSKLSSHQSSNAVLTPYKPSVVTTAELVNTQDIITTTTPSSYSRTPSLPPASVSVGLASEAIVGDMAALESPVLSASSLAMLAAQKQANFSLSHLESGAVTPSAICIPSSPILTTSVNTPVPKFPPPVIQEMSPPEMPAITDRYLHLTSAGYSTDEVMRDTISTALPINQNSNKELNQKSNCVTGGKYPSKKTSMQRQSATRNLITCTTPHLPVMEDSPLPATKTTASLNSTLVLSQSSSSPPHTYDPCNGIQSSLAGAGSHLFGTSFVSMYSDGPLASVSMARPGSRSAIYDANYALSLSPAPKTLLFDAKQSSSHTASVLPADASSNGVGGAVLPKQASSQINPSFSTYNNSNAIINTNHYSNSNLNTTIDVASSGISSPSFDLNSTVILETRSAPASSVKLSNPSGTPSSPMDFTSSYPASGDGSAIKQVHLNTTSTLDQCNTSPQHLPEDDSAVRKSHSARQLMFNSPQQPDQLSNQQNSTFCVDPTELTGDTNTGAGVSSRPLLGVDPMKLLEMLPIAAAKTAPVLASKTQPKLKSVLKNSTSTSSGVSTGGSRGLGVSQSFKQMPSASLRKSNSSVRPALLPTDKSGVVRRTMSFKNRRYNGGLTSTANAENVPPMATARRGIFLGSSSVTKPLSASVSCTNLAGGEAGRAALQPAASVGNLLLGQAKTANGAGPSSTTKHAAVPANNWRP